MKIIEREGDTLTVALDGKLDMNTSEAAHRELAAMLDGVKRLTLDLAELQYISSAGIRVLLALHKELFHRGGGLVIVHAGEDTYDILDITGFTDLVPVNPPQPVR